MTTFWRFAPCLALACALLILAPTAPVFADATSGVPSAPPASMPAELRARLAPSQQPPGPSATGCRDVRLDGVRADGQADDAPALLRSIEGALAASPGGAACVALPAGDVRLCQVTLPVFPNGLQIVGVGIGTTRIVPCDATTSVFVAPERAVASRFLEIRGMSVQPADRQTRGRTIDVSNTYNVVLRDIAGTNGWDFARLHDINNLLVCGTDLRSFGGTVFTIDGGFDFRFCAQNNYDDDRRDRQAASYLLVVKGGGIIVDAVDAIHCGDCYVIRPERAGESVEWIFVSQAQADTCAGSGWTLDAPAGTTIKGFHGVGLWSASCDGDGFRTTGEGTIDGVFLTGPRLQNNGRWGANFQDGANVFLSNPQISGNNREGGRAGGVNVSSRVAQFGMTGGKVGTMFGYADTQWANLVLGQGGGKEISVVGVNLCGFAAGGTALFDRGGAGREDSRNSNRRIVRDNLCADGETGRAPPR